MNPIKPEHYTLNIDLLKWSTTHNVHFIVGNIIKYIIRAKNKNRSEDINKALTYTEFLKPIPGSRRMGVKPTKIQQFIATNKDYLDYNQITCLNALRACSRFSAKKLSALKEALKEYETILLEETKQALEEKANKNANSNNKNGHKYNL